MANLPPSHYLDIGQLGEDLVTQWLESTGWLILHRRFTCRWGEIDIIAEYAGGGVDGGVGAEGQRRNHNSALYTQHFTLVFVEVKTRSSGNWDAGGRSAITSKKQVKLSRTAGMFLAEYPEKAEYICRFDVAIVYYQKIINSTEVLTASEASASFSAKGYQFYLQEYIPAAFDSAIDS